MTATRQREIDQNYQYFQTVVGTYLNLHQGKYALLHDCGVIGFYASLAEAVNAGHSQFDGAIFSIQEVRNSPVDMGFYSHATSDGGLHTA